MEKNAGANGPAARPIERREFGIALALLGAAAMLSHPQGAPAPPSPGTPAWVAVLASLGRELVSARPVPEGATVCTPSGWVLTDGEVDACCRLHDRFG